VSRARARRLVKLVAPAVASTVLALSPLFGLGAGCASTRESFAEPPPGEADGGDAATTSPFADAAIPCEGLACRQVDCAAKGLPTTTITGTVRDPAGLRPLYDVLVYVPNGPVDPLPSGVSCNRCATVPSGKPLVSALTGSDGRFVLENVPSGADVPLVVQIGKWRRRLTVPMVAECTQTPVAPEQTRLPKNKSEGDMPRIALTTGGLDPFECLLRKIGIEDAEFTADTGTGRVNLFQGHADDLGTPPSKLPPPASTPPATALWSDLAKMKGYDLVINACEGNEFLDDKPPASRQNFLDYLNAGGRAFNTHYHYTWMRFGQGGLPNVASWSSVGRPNEDSLLTRVDTSFPKGNAFAEWLVAVGASPAKGDLSITDPRVHVTAVSAPHVSWITGLPTAAGGSVPTVFHFTANAPLDLPADQQCGKALFSAFHVESTTAQGQPFPKECTKAEMSPQDLALEFMFFDLSSCVQDDRVAPQVPR